MEEVATVGTRQVEAGSVRVHVRVEERDETIQTVTSRQQAEVERVPVGRYVETAPPVRQEGDTIIVPILEEVLVTEKRLLLREEVRIRIIDTTEAGSHVVRLRREHADIQREQPPAPTRSDST